jgi:hypothetical protein
VAIRVVVLSNQTFLNQYLAPSGVGAEDPQGFGLAQPLSTTPPALRAAFRWVLRARIDGTARDNCSIITLGCLQNVVKYGAEARWRDGTAWTWKFPTLPIRDCINPHVRTPWYNPNYTFKVTRCGDTVDVEHGDSPDLVRNRGEPAGYVTPAGASGALIPWNDPVTGTLDSILSLKWTAQFDAFLIQESPGHHGTMKHDLVLDRNYIPVAVGWGVDLELTFDCTKPIGRRSALAAGYMTNVRLYASTGTHPRYHGGARPRLEQHIPHPVSHPHSSGTHGSPPGSRPTH